MAKLLQITEEELITLEIGIIPETLSANIVTTIQKLYGISASKQFSTLLKR